MTQYITIEDIIVEGKEVKKMISPNTNYRSGYIVADKTPYEKWKNRAIRYLALHYKGDTCNDAFRNAISKYENFCTPNTFESMIGILESCRDFPEIINTSTKLESKGSSPVSITNNITQNQHQEQSQKLVLEVFVDAINDELTGKQQKELKGIINTEKDPEKAKPKLIEKLLSFGSNVGASVIANILTNPNIWGAL